MSMRKIHKKSSNGNKATKPSDLIGDASHSGMHASTQIRMYGRSEHVLAKYSSVAAILRGEQIRELTPPVLPPQQGLTAAEKIRTNAVFSAEYQAYVDQRVKITQDKYDLKDWIHNSKLEKSFRTKFETTYPAYSTMELEAYIQALEEFYNSTISLLDSHKQDYARREWFEIHQSERETVPEFKIRIKDTIHRYNSLMLVAHHLTDTEIGEMFIKKLNSTFNDLKIKCQQEQILKSRIGNEQHPEPVPYLEHTGYPTSLEAAYQRAIEFEETIRNYKTPTQHLSTFTTMNEERKYRNSRTGEFKTLAQMDKDDLASEYGVGKCHICKKNGPQYKGDHFASAHDEFVEHRRNRHKDTRSRNPSKTAGRQAKAKSDKNKVPVQVALATLRKVAKAEESKAKKAEKNTERAKVHSEKAKTITQLLSTFEP